MQPRAEVAPCSLSIHDEELFPLVLRFVNLSGTGGHVQHFTIGVAKGRSGEVGDGSGFRPPHGDTPQRRAKEKGLLPDRGDALRDGDAWQLLATHKSFLPDCFKAALRERDACQRLTTRKGLISDAGHAGFDHYGFDFLPDILPGLIVKAIKVRHGARAAYGEGAGGVVVLPPRLGGVERAVGDSPVRDLPKRLPHVLPAVSLRQAGGHVQLDVLERHAGVKDIRIDVERRSPPHGDVRQCRAIAKGLLSDRSDTAREGDACQCRATGKGVLPNRLDTLREGDACQRRAIVKGSLSNRLDTRREGNACQRSAIPKGVRPDALYAGLDLYFLDLVPDILPRLCVCVGKVRHVARSGDGEGFGTGIVVPVQRSGGSAVLRRSAQGRQQ